MKPGCYQWTIHTDRGHHIKNFDYVLSSNLQYRLSPLLNKTDIIIIIGAFSEVLYHNIASTRYSI